MRAVRALWPTMEPRTFQFVRNLFLNSTALEFHLEPLGEPKFNGDMATIQVRRTQQATMKNGEKGKLNHELELTLKKSDGAWRIFRFPYERTQ